MKKVASKEYYKIEFELVSPLALGCGSNEETDSDVLVDSNQNPFIPGSSLAGVYRSLLDKETAEKFFGKKLVGTNKIDESRIIVYDAVLMEMPEGENVPFVGKRDMVALDEHKVSKPGAKFDFQIVEPGVKFVTYIEQTFFGTDNEGSGVLNPIFKEWQDETNGLSFGSKTMRGFGKTKALKVGRKKFDFASESELEQWIDFDIYQYDGWEAVEELKDVKEKEGRWSMTLLLDQKGGLSIREYSTRVNEADYEQMKLSGKRDSEAVIPGTSWAGAFRAQMEKLGMPKAEITEVFGSVKTRKKNVVKDQKNGTDGAEAKTTQTDDSHRSHISFSESYIKDGKDIVYSRNAIDRFTGGTVEGALYTESTRYNGTDICLTIGFDTEKSRRLAAPYLAAAIMDLNAGYMAVGGLTAVGRGMFEVKGINESDFCANYVELKQMIEEGK